MFFALVDLFRYRFRRAHYGDDPRENFMAMGHTGRVAKETLELIAPGDIIFCQRMNSALSWAIMYFGGYAVDHVGIYIGDGQVIHMTLSGTRSNSIDALAHGARILPYRMFELDEGGNPFGESQAKHESGGDTTEQRDDESPELKSFDASVPVLPPHLQLLLGGIEIVLGLRPTSFRWRYYLDLGLCGAIIDAMLWPLNHFPMALSIWVAWLLVLVNMRRRFRLQLRSGQQFQRDSHPGLLVLLLERQGGYIFPSRPVDGRWKARVLPSWVVLSSLRQKAPQSPNQRSNPKS